MIRCSDCCALTAVLGHHREKESNLCLKISLSGRKLNYVDGCGVTANEIGSKTVVELKACLDKICSEC